MAVMLPQRDISFLCCRGDCIAGAWGGHDALFVTKVVSWNTIYSTRDVLKRASDSVICSALAMIFIWD